MTHRHLVETYVTRPPRPDLSDPLEVLLYENDSQSWFSKWFKPPVKNTFVHYEQTEQPEEIGSGWKARSEPMFLGYRSSPAAFTDMSLAYEDVPSEASIPPFGEVVNIPSGEVIQTAPEAPVPSCRPDRCMLSRGSFTEAEVLPPTEELSCGDSSPRSLEEQALVSSCPPERCVLPREAAAQVDPLLPEREEVSSAVPPPRSADQQPQVVPTEQTEVPVNLGARAGEHSVGAAGHFDGTCRPCAHYWRPGGCSNGVNCTFCHVCDADALKRWKKEKVAKLREIGVPKRVIGKIEQ
mmetsp:Transcript_18329/g.49275  ORF Transcript_18329/g.49275 Transcript_18329/m.49275 type:complete len:295 (-) Transcript_18329:192-1076(-)